MLLEPIKSKAALQVSRKKSAEAEVIEVLGETGANPEAELYSEKTSTIHQKPLGTARHIRIVTIGPGARGLNIIRTLRRNLGDFEHVVYEKNPGVRGTWYENRYPGTIL